MCTVAYAGDDATKSTSWALDDIKVSFQNVE